MRVIIISRPKFPPPPEMMSPLMDAFADWRARYKPIMESFDFFVAGGGGCGIVNAPDDATLATMMMEYPWSPFSEVEVELLIDGDLALAQYRDFIRQQFGAPS
ncbi:MAG: hypothetical protein R2855_02875 [Thermomicrobiales bacterium]